LNPPLASIVIPTYNRPEHLERAIDSALKQTYENVEIIVVDDGSELNLKPFENKYPSVRFLKNKTNRGACYSRNRGLKASNGEYINFLDDDDELYPNKIKLQVQKFQSSPVKNLGFVTAHVLDKRSGKEIIKKNITAGSMYRQLLSGYAISGIETLLIKKECLLEIGGFDENLQSSQEYDLLIRLSENYGVDYVDEILSRENRSLDQISLNFDKKMSGAKYLFRKHDSRYREIGFLFWLKMRLKRYGLFGRYLIGKYLGEDAYRFTIKN